LAAAQVLQLLAQQQLSASALANPTPSLVSFTPAATPHPLSGKSLSTRYPDVEAGVLASITRHELRLKEFWKLNPTVRQSDQDSVLSLVDGRIIMQQKVAYKDFTSLYSLMWCLHVYFDVLIAWVPASGNVQASWEVSHGSIASPRNMNGEPYLITSTPTT
jgi:hypothetical protein